MWGGGTRSVWHSGGPGPASAHTAERGLRGNAGKPRPSAVVRPEWAARPAPALAPSRRSAPFDARPRWHQLQNRKQKQPAPPQACASRPWRAALNGPGRPGLQQRWPCPPSQGGLRLPDRVGPGTTSWEPAVLQSALPLPPPPFPLGPAHRMGGAEGALAAREQGPLPRAPRRRSWESCSGGGGCDGAGRAGGRGKRPRPFALLF